MRNRDENFNSSGKGNLESVNDEDYLYNDFDGNGDMGGDVGRSSDVDTNIDESDEDLGTGIGSDMDDNINLDTGTNSMGTHGNVGKNRGDI